MGFNDSQYDPAPEMKIGVSELLDNRKHVLKRLLSEIEKKNSWGKNELKDLILKLLMED